jgi:uncharacterized membrane protein
MVLLSIILLLFIFSTAVNAEEINTDVWEKAREDGVQFRAVGNEPGWLIEIREDKKIRFINDYGSLEIKAPVDDLWLGPAGEDKIYYVENDVIQFQVIIMKKSYQDNMSGETFPYQVRVVFPSKSYVGGGRLLIEAENEDENKN